MCRNLPDFRIFMYFSKRNIEKIYNVLYFFIKEINILYN